jgi:hypothetical protein
MVIGSPKCSDDASDFHMSRPGLPCVHIESEPQTCSVCSPNTHARMCERTAHFGLPLGPEHHLELEAFEVRNRKLRKTIKTEPTPSMDACTWHVKAVIMISTCGAGVCSFLAASGLCKGSNERFRRAKKARFPSFFFSKNYLLTGNVSGCPLYIETWARVRIRHVQKFCIGGMGSSYAQN